MKTASKMHIYRCSRRGPTDRFNKGVISKSVNQNGTMVVMQEANMRKNRVRLLCTLGETKLGNSTGNNA